jgi:hypothetical protein
MLKYLLVLSFLFQLSVNAYGENNCGKRPDYPKGCIIVCLEDETGRPRWIMNCGIDGAQGSVSRAVCGVKPPPVKGCSYTCLNHLWTLDFCP